jgi:hypothetical protein
MGQTISATLLRSTVAIFASLGKLAAPHFARAAKTACRSWRRTICDGPVLGSAMLRAGSWSRSNSFWGTSQFKPPNGTLGASSEFDQPLMIALGSDRTLDVAEPVVEGLPTI